MQVVPKGVSRTPSGLEAKGFIERLLANEPGSGIGANDVYL